MKKLMTTTVLVLAASSVQAENPKNDVTLKLSANTVPCYGNVAGMCEQNGESFTHNQFVSIVSGEPSLVKSIHYFSNRDDKIILEYTTLEMDYIERMAKVIGIESLNYTSVLGLDGRRSDYLEQQKLIVQKDCPKKNGCQLLIEFINNLAR
ncbi:hypothetical protein [Vibrio cholerae]|uniref:hypothetical protein n=1 Tax=Vibrio cholerae TaxID=666 RepID=UPI0013B377BE|nr:hypothetical protein [Vibrio cholerae]